MYDGAVRTSLSSFALVSLCPFVRLMAALVAVELAAFGTCNCRVNDVVMIFLMGRLSSNGPLVARANCSGDTVVAVV